MAGNSVVVVAGRTRLLPLRIMLVVYCVYNDVCRPLLPPELGGDVGLDNALLAELLYALLLGLHLLVLLEVLNVLRVREVFELGVLVVVPGSLVGVRVRPRVEIATHFSQ